MKIMNRLFLALVLAGLIPLIPLVYMLHKSLEMGSSTLAPESVGMSLEDGLSMVREYLKNENAELAEILIRIVTDDFQKQKNVVMPNDTTLNLFVMHNDTCYTYNGMLWNAIHPPIYNEMNNNFPTHIYHSLESNGSTWILEKKLPERFIKWANNLHSGLASWKLRSIEKGRLFRSITYMFLILYGTLVIISIITGIMVISPTGKRIKSLTDTADEISEGNESLRAAVPKGGEERKLASSFNLMLDRLHEEKKKSTDMEKRAAWRELARVLAHEIKNPLTPIQLSIQELFMSYKGNDERYKSMLETTHEVVNEEVESLRSLVREFSEFARAPKLEAEITEPYRIFEDLKDLYGTSIEIVNIKDKSLKITVDREKIRRACINLLDNAIHASGDKGIVILSAKHENKSLHIKIEDNGNGISEDMYDKIFEPHVTTKRTGMGLGLPIVKTICENHGGNILLSRSKSLGGACFEMVLPDNFLKEK